MIKWMAAPGIIWLALRRQLEIFPKKALDIATVNELESDQWLT
jgi:hypothetical protein